MSTAPPPLSIARSVSRRKWFVLIAGGAMVVTVVALFSVLPARYSAEATVHVPTVVSGSTNSINFETQLTDRLISTYARLASSEILVEQVVRDLNLSERPDIEVTVVQGTELITIEATYRDAGVAAAIANYVADYVVTTSSSLHDKSTGAAQDQLRSQLDEARAGLNEALDTYLSAAARFPPDSPQVAAAARAFDLAAVAYNDVLSESRNRDVLLARNVSIVDAAQAPELPSSPSLPLRILLGLVAGLAVGIGLALYLESRDPLVVTPDDIAGVYRSPLLAVVPAVPSPKSGAPLGSVWRAGDASPFDESMLRLRSALFAAEQNPGIVMVVSARQGDGKSTIAMRLGAAVASTGKQVVVVDANMRDPHIHALAGVETRVGLHNADLEDNPAFAVQSTPIDGLHVVGSSASASQFGGGEGPGGHGMLNLLSYLRVRYDLILVDTAAVGAGADTVVLAPLADAYIYIARSGKSGQREITDSLRQLDSVRARQIGFVLNAGRDSLGWLESRVAKPLKVGAER